MRWDDETIDRRAKFVRKCKDITQSEDLTPYAMQFILSYDEITTVIPGIKNVDQLRDHLEYVKEALSPETKEAFIKLYNEEIKDNPLPW